MQRLATTFPGQLPFLAQRFFSLRKYAHLEREARDLIARIRDDGYAVETYQFPTVIEERRANSTLLARLFGLPALDADREVLMLYSSMFDRAGEAILWSYAREIDAVGVGSTGGGVSIEGLPTLHKCVGWISNATCSSRHITPVICTSSPSKAVWSRIFWTGWRPSIGNRRSHCPLKKLVKLRCSAGYSSIPCGCSPIQSHPS